MLYQLNILPKYSHHFCALILKLDPHCYTYIFKADHSHMDYRNLGWRIKMPLSGTNTRRPELMTIYLTVVYNDQSIIWKPVVTT